VNSSYGSRLARVKRVLLTPVSKSLAQQLTFHSQQQRWYPPSLALVDEDAIPSSRQHDDSEECTDARSARRVLSIRTTSRTTPGVRPFWRRRTTGRSALGGSINHNTFTSSSTSTTKRSKSVSEHWWEQLQTVPNLLTLGRIGVAPVIAHLIMTDQVYPWAGALCVAAAVSDVLDGWIAKTWPATQSTVLGTYLDPLADKILINTTATSLWYVGVLPTPLVVLWWTKDIVLVGATYAHVAQRTPDAASVWSVMDPVRTPLRVSPTATSKVNTGLQFVTLAAGLAYGSADMVTVLCGATAVTTVASVVSYWDYGAFQATRQKMQTRQRQSS
jgi:cardiolipin synthase